MTGVIDVVRAVVAPFTRTRLFRRHGRRLMPRIERWWAVVSGGDTPVSGLLVPSLVLHTIGARSGEPREVRLMYAPDGEGRAIVAGTNFAGDRHPAWTANLLAQPDAAITVHGVRMQVRARLIADHEREHAWTLIETQWPGYRSYERESGRTVRLFRLQPVRDGAAPADPPADVTG